MSVGGHDWDGELATPGLSAVHPKAIIVWESYKRYLLLSAFLCITNLSSRITYVKNRM